MSGSSAAKSKLVQLTKSGAGVALALALGVATACGSSSDKGAATAGAAGEPDEEAGGSSDAKGGASSHAGNSGNKAGNSSIGDAGEGGSAEEGGSAGADNTPIDMVGTNIGPAGGDVMLSNGTTVTVPPNSLGTATAVTIDPADVPDTAPDSVEQVTPGFTIDFGGATLTVPAKAKLKLPYKPTEGDLVILLTTDSGTTFVTYTLETDGGITYAVIDVVAGGRYLAVRLKSKPGCDDVLATAPTIATQADVDKLSKVKRIVGNLQISGTGITSLAGLKCLQQLDGSLLINNTSVTSLQGLEALTFVSSNNYYTYGVQVTNNSLLDTASLPSVLAVGTGQNNYYQSLLQITSNPVLSSFAADAIESAGLNFVSNGAASTGTAISMAALKSAQSITIQQNPALKDVAGFGALERVVGALNLSGDGLTNIDGFKSLTSAGALTLSNNVALTSATGLSKLKTVSSVSISTNQLLKAVDFAELTSITQTSAGSASITVSANSALTAFKADKLPSLTGSLSFSNNGNASVNTVLSFASLASIAGGTTITQNLGLQTLDGLKALAMAANVSITSNAALQSIAGLSALKTVGGLYIGSNAKLTAISGLTKLTRVDQALTITQNTLLKTADFPAVATMGGELNVSGNPALTSFTADALRVAPASLAFQTNGTVGTATKMSFAALTSVATQLQIDSNPGLTKVDGFGALTSIGGNLSIYNNAALSDLSSLTKLSTITGSLTISTNPLLASVNGLAGLSRVSQSVSIGSNAALADVTLPMLTSAAGISIASNAALANVSLDTLTASSGSLNLSNNGTAAAVTTTTISFAALTATSGFTVSGNPKLKLLTGFPQLKGISGSFQVYTNALLPNCSIVALRNQIQTTGAISGSIYITGNLTDGCATT
jgi:Receptor L domain